MKNDLVSVIIPVYKVENYLNKCVESVVNQTYKNLEIILVDDGSPDNCPKMCDEWAKKDSRIKVIHKQNGGVSSARNMGIDISTGEYISFVDSDDFIDNTMFEKLYISITKNKCDIAACNYCLIDESNNITKRVENNLKNISPENFYKYYVYDYCYMQNNTMIVDSIGINIWTKLYSKKIIGDNRFLSCAIGEDFIFNCDVITPQTKICAVDENLYYYFLRSDSVMHTFNENKIKQRLEFIKLSMQKYQQKVDEQTFNAFKFLSFKQMMIDLTYCKEKSIYKNYINQIKELKLNTKQNYKVYIKNIKKFKTKILAFLIHNKMFYVLKLLMKK